MANITPALKGAIADMQTSVLRSYTAGTAVEFGHVVTLASEGTCQRGGTNEILGIAVLDQTILPVDTDRYALNDVVNVVSLGTIWVMTMEACNAGDPVTYNPANGQVNTTGTAVPNAVFETSGAANDIVMVRLK